MDIIRDKDFGGERPLFATHDLRLENITITDGESGIKQCQNIEAYDCKFYGKYPWWHVDGARIENCYFAMGSRSAIKATVDVSPVESVTLVSGSTNGWSGSSTTTLNVTEPSQPEAFVCTAL